MKTLFSFLILVLMGISSYAQINPKISKLMEQLEELGVSCRVRKVGGKKIQPFMNCHALLDLNYVADSLRERKNTKMKQVVTTVRHTLDELQEDAQESYHYEYHNDGKDTIVYSMNLSQNSTHKIPRSNYSTFISDEYLRFQYEPFWKDMHAILEYKVMLPEDTLETFPIQDASEALCADIDCLFSQHHIQPRKALWQHDKEYSDSCDLTTIDITNHYTIDKYSEGKTEATIYTVPLIQEQLAQQLLLDFDASVKKYAIGQLWNYYDYNCRILFKKDFNYLLQSLLYEDHNIFAIYSVGVCRDNFGFHFLVTKTQGSEWIPRHWPSIKSFVNGKMTYFKGMKPKLKKY